MRTLWIFKVVVGKNEKNTFNKKNRLKIAKKTSHVTQTHLYMNRDITETKLL